MLLFKFSIPLSYLDDNMIVMALSGSFDVFSWVEFLYLLKVLFVVGLYPQPLQLLQDIALSRIDRRLWFILDLAVSFLFHFLIN